MKNDRPKIGLALSGASGRAIAHIGVLEVLEKNQIPIDFLTACSSGAIIAASYACKTMPQLKSDWLNLNRQFIIKMLSLDTSGEGAIKLDKFGEWLRRYTLDNKIEEVKPALGLVCADILTGEPVILSLGDMVKAVQASCTMPGLFPPVEWGRRLLVDGGLYSIVPTTQAKLMGAEIVIGVDIASSRYAFPRNFHRLWRSYKVVRNSLPARIYARVHNWVEALFTKSIDFIYYNQSDILEESKTIKPDMFAVLAKALDISERQSEEKAEAIEDCDVLISPNVKHLGKMDFENAQMTLDEGRRAATAAIPEIKKVIRNYQWKKENGLPVKIKSLSL